jgi:signal transduction histidine kinase
MSERPSRVQGRVPRSPYVLDGLIAVMLGALCLAAFVTGERTAEQPREADALGALLIVGAAAALAFRRRWPLAVLVVTTGATVAVYVLGYPDSGMPTVGLVALYTVAVLCDRPVTIAATVAVLAVIVLIIADAGDMDGGSLAGALAVFAMAAVWGDRKKVRDAYTEQLALRAAEKEQERVEAARRAVAEERLRIARELHDVVAHAMSVVAVQSGVGAHVIDSRPDEAKRILETISHTSRDSLDEMRRLLGVLRSEQAPGGPADAALAPTPGLDELDDLMRHVVDAGVPVEAEVQGERGDVPPGVDLAAYRIVQEALTNVLKHAGPARASVRVRYGRDAVQVEVVDDGRGAAGNPGGAGGAAANGSGNGLVGMRERAALYRGELEAGPRVGGGYRVAATLRYAP